MSNPDSRSANPGRVKTQCTPFCYREIERDSGYRLRAVWLDECVVTASVE